MLGFAPLAATPIAATPEVETPVTSIAAVTFQFLVDWDRDGVFSGYDDITSYVQIADWKLGFNQPFQLTPDESTCRLTLKNTDKRFSPEYSAGTYYGKLAPHKYMQIRAISNEAGTVVMWTGWTDVITPLPMPIGEQRSVIEGKGLKQFYDNSIVHLPVMQDVRADEVLEEIIQTVPLPPSTTPAWRLGVTGFAELTSTTRLFNPGDFYQLETGRSTYPYAGDSWDESHATDVVYDLLAGEPGRLYFHRDGRVIFWNRDHLAADQATDGTASVYIAANYLYGDTLANHIRVKNYPRTVSGVTTDTLWALEDEISIAPGKERKIRAAYKDEDSKNKVGATDVQTPNTGDGTLVYAPVSPELDVVVEADGDSAEIILRNNTPHDKAVTTLVLRGRKITTFEAQEFVQRDITSIGLYGQREYMVDTKMMANDLLADSIASHELSMRKDPHGRMKSVQLRPRDSTTRAQAIIMTIGNRVRIADTQTAHDEDYFILGEQHRYAEGARHDATWFLERADRQARWILGSSLLGAQTALGI